MEARQLAVPPRFDILFVSGSTDLARRVQDVAVKLKLACHCVTGLPDGPAALEEIGVPQTTLLDLSDLPDPQASLERLYAWQKMAADRKYICVVADGADEMFLQSLKQAGVAKILSRAEFLNSVRLEFVTAGIEGDYHVINIQDLIVDTEIKFKVFHFLPLNNKYVLITFPDSTLNQIKYKSLEKVKNIYLRKEDLKQYQEYVIAHSETHGKNSVRAALRLSAIPMIEAYINLRQDLAFSPAPQPLNKVTAHLVPVLEGQKTLNTKIKNAGLFHYLQMCSQNSFLQFDRSLWIAGLASALAELSGLAQPEATFKAGVLAQTNLLSLSPAFYHKWQTQNELERTANESALYAETFAGSARLAKERVPGTEELTLKIIQAFCERHNGEGPGKWAGDLIPREAALLRIADHWVRTFGDKPVTNPLEVAKSFEAAFKSLKTLGWVHPATLETLEKAKLFTWS